jgi:hypothetical protein
MAVRPGGILKRALLPQAVVITLLALFLTSARAGGPKYVAGVSYFNPGLAGTPLTWSQGAITYYTDQGDLSSLLPGPAADAFVAAAFSQWTSIPIAMVTATHGGQLAEDVNGANVFVNPGARSPCHRTFCPPLLAPR